jgi:hypothetical protein
MNRGGVSNLNPSYVPKCIYRGVAKPSPPRGTFGLSDISEKYS